METPVVAAMRAGPRRPSATTPALAPASALHSFQPSFPVSPSATGSNRSCCFRSAPIAIKTSTIFRTANNNDGVGLRKPIQIAGNRAVVKRVKPACAGREPGEEAEEEPSRSSSNDDEGEDLDMDAKFRLQSTDWRAFRARLVKGATLADSGKGGRAAEKEQPQRWAHPLVKPEKGCLLIANPSAFDTHQTYFNQAVIFIFEHDVDGTAGVILNRPTTYALGQIPGFEQFKPEFTDSRLYMGGDVGTNLIQVIHRVPGLRDSKEVVSGVYLGGPTAVKNSVKGGESLPEDYRWFLGYCGWRPGQLERELAVGVWYLASGSKDIITDHCIKLKRPLWRQVLELMGGDYSLISKRAYGEI